MGKIFFLLIQVVEKKTKNKNFYTVVCEDTSHI